jgi:hypothetical protein
MLVSLHLMIFLFIPLMNGLTIPLDDIEIGIKEKDYIILHLRLV